jgi:hypothetical protein
MRFLIPACANVVMAATQDEYETIHLRREVRTYAHAGGGPDYQAVGMTARLEFTREEWHKLLEGEDLYITVLGSGWPPMSVTVGDPNPETAPYEDRPEPGPVPDPVNG